MTLWSLLQVKIASDPLFGDIQDLPESGRRESKTGTSWTGTKPRGSSFATNVAPAEKQIEPVNAKEENLPIKACLYCGAGHSLDVCLLLDKRTQEEKMSFLKENKMGFGCLCIGHRSRDCKRRLTCRLCNLKHPTLLLIHSKTKPTCSTQANGGSEMAREGAVVSVQSSGLTGAGKRDCTLSILPACILGPRYHGFILY